MQAPTASNAQDWRWLVITDADKRAAIADIYRSIGADYLAYAAKDASDPQTQTRVRERVQPDRNAGQGSGARHPCLTSRIDNSNMLVAASAWASIIPAGWSFLLALRSRGLGSVWTTMHLAKEKEVAEVLGIPDTVTQAALFPVAYTIGTDFRPATRPPAETSHLSGTAGEKADAVLHRAIPRRRATEESLAGVASAGAAERAAAAGAEVAHRQHGNPERRQRSRRGSGPHLHLPEVPKYLLTGGRARSWETVTEAEVNKLSRYTAVGAPLWSRAEGYHQLEEQSDGTTVLTFHETYHAYNPVLRFPGTPVHAKISRDNLDDLRARTRVCRQVRRLT